MKNRRSFIIGLSSHYLSTNEKKFLKKYKPWGVILFSRNIGSINQTKKLTNEIRKIFNDNKYPILVDQEGGRVSRIEKFIDTSIFTGEYFGKIYKKNNNHFKIYYKIFNNQISFILKEIGININTVPVLDLRHNKSNDIIGDRSFASDPKIVSKIGDYCIDLLHNHNIGTVIKHIPGHGLTNIDSHISTPIVRKKIKRLLKEDFYPFKNKKSLFAMTAHIIYHNIDSLNTATHSKKIIKIIRDKIKFKNIIISDDISMKSLKYSIGENTERAFTAGCNLVLHCNGKYNEMISVANKSPKLSNFLIKKTSQFYKILG